MTNDSGTHVGGNVESEVRHITLNHILPNALALACEVAEKDGLMLEKVVPYTQYESVAVFAKRPEIRCECGWRGIGNHYHDERMGSQLGQPNG
jgi:hypothetical protein